MLTNRIDVALRYGARSFEYIFQVEVLAFIFTNFRIVIQTAYRAISTSVSCRKSKLVRETNRKQTTQNDDTKLAAQYCPD